MWRPRSTARHGADVINRYFDPVHGVEAAKILPGQYYVTVTDEMIVTVLGSCVAACIRDTMLGIGGMNHFMLPDGEAENATLYGAAERYGQFAMESLINEILGLGGRRERLEVKLAGGGCVLKNGAHIGAHNIEFAHRFLHTDGLSVAAEDVGGDWPRKIYYFPQTGVLRVKLLKELANDTIFERDASYRRRLANPTEGTVELFG